MELKRLPVLDIHAKASWEAKKHEICNLYSELISKMQSVYGGDFAILIHKSIHKRQVLLQKIYGAKAIKRYLAWQVFIGATVIFEESPFCDFEQEHSVEKHLRAELNRIKTLIALSDTDNP